MATSQAVDTGLQELAKRHLWMHFSRMGPYGPGHEIPIITRAEGCYVYDEHGNRYLDGLPLLRANAGHGRRGVRRGRRPPGRRSSTSTRSGATPTRVRSSWRRGIASLAPGDLNRVFFTSGGGEAVESALKLARNYHRMHGQRAEAQRRSLARSPTTAPRSGRSRPPGYTELRSQLSR